MSISEPNPLFRTPEGQTAVLTLYDKALSSWPIPYRERMIETRFGTTAVIECGKEDCAPLVFIHGASSNATSWIADVPVLSKRFHIFLIDVIGEPGKSAGVRLPFTTNAYAEWLQETIRSLTHKPVSVVGLSQGGWLAIKYAIAHPGNVDRLVLLTPGGITPTKPSFILRAMLLTMLGKRGTETLNRYVFGKQPIDSKTLAYMNTIAENFIPRFDKEYIFTDGELKRLNMPVLYIGGCADVIRDNAKNIERLKPLLPKLKTRLLPDAGHVLINTGAYTLPFLTSP